MVIYELMDRERLFEKLDIDKPEDFKFYENFEALMEEDEHVEEEHMREIFEAADLEMISDHINSFFESFSSNIPEDETELAIILETFKNNISSAASSGKTHDSLAGLASEIYRFRRWYALEHNAFNEGSGTDLSVRDARYDILAAKLLGEDINIDFGRAITSGPDSYEVRIKDII